MFLCSLSDYESNIMRLLTILLMHRVMLYHCVVSFESSRLHFNKYLASFIFYEQK